MARFLFFFPVLFIVLLLLVSLIGCESLSYYRHLATGQVRTLASRQSIESLIANPGTDETLRENLQMVLSIREFAKNELHLPADGQFLYYVDHGNTATVWNVYTAPELSMSPLTWCFPIVGCTVYKGFFDPGKAWELADQLKKEGKDVYVSAVGGYSTLGWFSDPIFRNIIDRGEVGMAAYIFHELAHKVVYIKNDTHFNEGFAIAVEHEGVRRWLESRGRNELYEQFIRRYQKRIEFSFLVKNTRTSLARLYNTPEMAIPDKRYQKTRLFEQMQADYQDLKYNWGGYSGYDNWFASPLNNARLIPFGAYYDHVPAFINMLRASGGDMAHFYEMVIRLSQKPRMERNRILKEYESMTYIEAARAEPERYF